MQTALDAFGEGGSGDRSASAERRADLSRGRCPQRPATHTYLRGCSPRSPGCFLDAVAPRRCAGCDARLRPADLPELRATIWARMPVPPRPPHAPWQRVRGLRVRRAGPGGSASGQVRRRSSGAVVSWPRLTSSRLARPAAVHARTPSSPCRSARAGAGSAGYNQSEIIAEAIAEARDVPVLDDLGADPRDPAPERPRRGDPARQRRRRLRLDRRRSRAAPTSGSSTTCSPPAPPSRRRRPCWPAPEPSLIDVVVVAAVP